MNFLPKRSLISPPPGADHGRVRSMQLGCQCLVSGFSNKIQNGGRSWLQYLRWRRSFWENISWFQLKGQVLHAFSNSPVKLHQNQVRSLDNSNSNNFIGSYRAFFKRFIISMLMRSIYSYIFCLEILLLMYNSHIFASDQINEESNNNKKCFLVTFEKLSLQTCTKSNFWATFWEITGNFLGNLEQLVESPIRVRLRESVRLRECVNTESDRKVKLGFKKASVSRAVRLRECSLAESWLYYDFGIQPWVVSEVIFVLRAKRAGNASKPLIFHTCNTSTGRL